MIILLLLSSAQLRLWIMQIHLFHRLHDNPGDDEVAVPFVIRGYEVPRCPFRAGLVQRILVRLHVLFPEFSFRKIVTTELPPAWRGRPSAVATASSARPCQCEGRISVSTCPLRRVSARNR